MMARILEDEIERLKKEIAIERLAVGFGIELERQGADLVGRCPFQGRISAMAFPPEPPNQGGLARQGLARQGLARQQMSASFSATEARSRFLWGHFSFAAKRLAQTVSIIDRPYGYNPGD